MRPIYPLLPLAMLLSTACAFDDVDDLVEDDDAIDLRAIDVVGPGHGTVFNTNFREAAFLSEHLQPMGTPHHGYALSSVQLSDDTMIDHFLLGDNDGDIVAVEDGGLFHSGAALVGSTWSLSPQYLKKDDLSLRIVSHAMIDGVAHYRFQNTVGGTWNDNCPDHLAAQGGGPGLARMLHGFAIDESTGAVTREDMMSFIACDTGAVGKAVKWGYYKLGLEILETTQPINPQKGQPPSDPKAIVNVDILGPLVPAVPVVPVLPVDAFKPLELAIRVVRADYCYDATSHTKNGTPLLIEDVWGVRGPDGGVIEAVWGATGLICAGTGRGAFSPATDCPGKPIPTCDPTAQLANYPQGLIITRLPGPGTQEDEL